MWAMCTRQYLTAVSSNTADLVNYKYMNKIKKIKIYFYFNKNVYVQNSCRLIYY